MTNIPRFGPAKWEALEYQTGVAETLKLLISPDIVDAKMDVLKDICTTAMNVAAARAYNLLRERGMESYVAITSSGPQELEQL